MRVLIVLTYYRPHTSGLTIYAERLAKGLARRGHEVTVLTSHYAHRLAFKERVEGVRVVRSPVLFRVSKGVIMPVFGFQAWTWVNWADVVSLHLPQFDAAGVARPRRLLRLAFLLLLRAVELHQHGDLRLPRLEDRLFQREARLQRSEHVRRSPAHRTIREAYP